ncbi:MAG: hypothetical protein ACK4MI_03940 [Brevundimonas sp.]|uniref:hypothetical protein n=1 Tax=Brevundimonas sp. TaxID=1871086 RepID=UPI00391BE84B
MKTPDTYLPSKGERRLNRTSQNIDPAWDDSDTTDFMRELDLADVVRSEDREW